MKKIGIIGSGAVARALATGLVKHNYQVMMGTGDKSKLEKLQKEIRVVTGTFADAASFGEIVIIAVKGTAAEQVVRGLAGSLKGKTVIDVTNPIADKPPVNGVLGYFTSFDESLMEKLQKLVPGADFVKAFNSVANAFMIDPDFGQKPTMFICGNSASAKKEVASLLEEVGWEAEDMGKVESARAIEPLCMLMCIPGIVENNWAHAYKFLRLNS